MKKFREVLQEFREHKNLKRIDKDNPIISRIIKKLEYQVRVANDAASWLRSKGQSDVEALKESTFYTEVIDDLQSELEYLGGVIMTQKLSDIIRSLYPPAYIEQTHMEQFLHTYELTKGNT